MFDFIDSSIDVHDLPNVLEARKIRKLVPKHDVPLRVFGDMAPSKKKNATKTKRREKKGELLKASHHKFKKNERKKLSPRNEKKRIALQSL